MAVHPSSVKNTFARHMTFWMLFLPLLTLILIPLVMPEQGVEPTEMMMVRDMGIDLPALEKSSTATFSNWFVNTGVMAATVDFFSGRNAGNHGSVQNGTSAKWIKGVWVIVYRAIWRMKALSSIFFLPVALLCVPALLDGLSVRARKWYRLESHNNVSFYSSGHTVTMAVGLFVFLPFVPITLTANMLAIMLLALVCGIWLVTANYQQGR